MKSFIIYKNEKKNADLDNVVFLQDSFSFLAFFLTYFYTLFNKIWILSLMLFLFFAAIEFSYYSEFINLSTYLCVRIAVMMYSGCSYFNWYQDKLKKKGYVVYDVIYANDLNEAKLRFCEVNNN